MTVLMLDDQREMEYLRNELHDPSGRLFIECETEH